MREIITSLAALALLTVGEQASAASWHWFVETNAGNKICAKSIADEYVLGCNNTAQGNLVYRKVATNTWSPDVQSAKGLSITQNVSNARPWLVAFDNRIWWRRWPSEGGAAWLSSPTNTCEGGTTVIRKVLGEKSIAAGNWDGVEKVYYVEDGTADNTIRWWNGACWSRLPVLPSSTAREVGMFDDANDNGGHGDGWPWVLAHNGVVYRWDGFNGTWVAVISGFTGLGSSGSPNFRMLIGSDTTKLFTFNQATSTTSQDATWTFGTIQEIGAFVQSSTGRTVLRPNGDVYRFSFF